jgi:hypothetical protein
MPFKRTCLKCGEEFNPKTQNNFVCDKCKPKTFLDDYLGVKK